VLKSLIAHPERNSEIQWQVEGAKYYLVQVHHRSHQPVGGPFPQTPMSMVA